MIFSVWNADGGYDYYKTSQRHGIGDDLPDAQLPPSINGIGVPSQDAGRTVPMGAKKSGHGKVPKGVMAPMDRSQVKGLSGALGFVGGNTVVNGLIVVGMIWIGYELGRRA